MLLLRNGEQANSGILRRIAAAKRSVRMRCFDWRDDETGAVFGRALLAAADRGVLVTIEKDRVGANYEYLEGSQQSFLHKRMDLLATLQTLFLMAVYDRWGSLRQRPNPLAEALCAHPNVRLEAGDKRFDHSKVYVIDDEVLILGGMGIGDDFHRSNVDFMVELEGADLVHRFHELEAGRAHFDATRDVDFLVRPAWVHDCPLLDARLNLIASARERLTIEMAYFGDPRCTDALVDAVRRGVQLTMLTARRANIIGDLNLGTCDRILRRTGAPDHVRVFLHPRMIHGKAIVADGRAVQIGSANLTLLSHTTYAEVDLYCREPQFALAVEQAILRECDNAVLVRPRIPYRRAYFYVETAIIRYQSRRRKPAEPAAVTPA
jgi:phosphatidylserine/phosphatidylglycerophosphate/cardiolipin synthase-like enzyme